MSQARRWGAHRGLAAQHLAQHRHRAREHPQEAEHTIRALVRSPELRDRATHLAQRRIWSQHTYAHRAAQVLEAVADRGLPALRHGWMVAPGTGAARADTQFFLGEDVLVAPVLGEGVRQREVVFPGGVWRHLFTGKTYRSGRATVATPLGQPAAFVRETNPMAGDAVEENATGYLMRNAQWYVQDIGFDGFRLDSDGRIWTSAGDGVHCFAPAGLSVSSHSYSKRCARKPLSHVVGSVVQAPSSPLVTVSTPLPVP